MHSDKPSPSPPPGSSVPPQSKGKGKHRVGTSPSAVPAKRSAQGEDREDKVKEEAAGSSAKRKKREKGQMAGEGFSKHQLVSPHVLFHAIRSPHHGLQ